MEETELYLYRGTTRGWPGNRTLQSLGITCTTTDSLVATLFAIECLGHGQGVVYLAPRAPLEEWIGPPNYFNDLECGLNIEISPTEFIKYAQFDVHPHRAREILMEMGFVVPYLIHGYCMLEKALEESRRESYRLSAHQIRGFNRRARLDHGKER